MKEKKNIYRIEMTNNQGNFDFFIFYFFLKNKLKISKAIAT